MSTAVSAQKSGSCKPCWVKTLRGETMNRVHTTAFRFLLTALALSSCFAITTFAQNASPSPSQDPTKKPDSPPAAQQQDPFAPEQAKPLPPGMTGSDVNDPRTKLTPGVFDAGEAAMGIKHLQLV